MSAEIKTFDVLMQLTDSKANTATCVLHTDHLAAMAAASAYDEEKERGLFEAEMQSAGFSAHELSRNSIGGYRFLSGRYAGWLDCAKARAKAAGCL
jgi:hypothetical protein